ncbi:hypothetical protein HNR23_003479 [Nocardiopsis mwathae]|uniref:DUF3558 domain-containing protein n=1 Tax=Nocardiopsis mwathae TaxID=1472723 RepID=A0A7X0D7W1_9ACTN|nr:hypothetical protein [Nocardiopsis mwathae]MBB6173419.1 hypothetical protein [Nocardiopsis mwathae]
MPERDEAPRKKKVGLHGWRAFLVVFASGTLAAFLVVGIIVGILQAFVSSVSSAVGGEATPEVPRDQQTGRPQAALEPGKLDICTRTLPRTRGVNINRVDPAENYNDPALQGRDSEETERTVRDECDWTLTPDYSSAQPWDFHFSYEAIIDAAPGEDRDEVASGIFDDRKKELESFFSPVKSDGGGPLTDADRSQVLYGDSSGSEQETTYVVLAQTRSAVYEIRLVGEPGLDNEPVPEQAYRHEVEKLVSRLSIEFGLLIPE